MLYRISNLKKFFLLVLLSLFMVNQSAQANPTGGQVVDGVAQIVKTSPQRLDIVQQSNRAALNWQSFNIKANEHVNFQQPSAQSSTLNRVMGQDPSAILGRLTANGKVFLLNPNGILFSKQAKVDVGGLVATTANIKNADFMAGRLQFNGKVNNAAIVNHGQINAKDNGLVALVAPGINNSGIINAKLGRVVLASGRKFTLDLYGDKLIKFAVDDDVVNQVKASDGGTVNQSGVINAEGGQVLLTTGTAKQAVDNVVNMSGIIRAQSVGQHNGQIILSAGRQGKAQVSGTLDVSGQKPGQTGGVIQVLGKQVNLGDKARLNASGQSGGGNIYVGGDYQGKGKLITAQTTMVNQGSRINADALTQGNGGKVIVWADGTTRFNGNISAKGGNKSGDGGFAEVSGKKNLVYRGNTELSANHGKAGTLLLDPTNITVGKSGSTTLNANDSTIKASTISETLGKGTSVKLLASNDISVNADIDSRYQDAPSGAGLDLNAGNNVNLNANILTKNGAITATATNGNITMAKDKILFAGNQDINLTAGKGINAQHLLTSGDVKLTANSGNVELKQALGGAVDKNGKPLFKLAALTATASQGAVMLNGVDATSDVKVAALKNIDVNGPINTSGGGITLVSKGSNADKTAINLNHNLYTNGKDIILDGDVLLNPTAKELVTPLNGNEPAFTGQTKPLSCSGCDAVLCPKCELINKNDPSKGVLLKTKSDVLRYIQVDLREPPKPDGTPGAFIIKGFFNGSTLADAEMRVANLIKLFSVRQITINSNGGNIKFKKDVQRESNIGIANFKTAFGINDLSSLDNLGQINIDTGNYIKPEFNNVVFRDSFIHHSLQLFSNSGDVVFDNVVGNKRNLIISYSTESVNSTQNTQIIPHAIGSFLLYLNDAKNVIFKNGFYVNELIYHGKNLSNSDFPLNNINLTGNFSIVSAPYRLNYPLTTYGPTLSSSPTKNFSGINGINLGLPPSLGNNSGGNGGSNSGGGSGGNGSTGGGSSGGGSSATTNSILSQVQVAQRNETCKKSAQQDNKDLIKTEAKSDEAHSSVVKASKVTVQVDKQVSVNSDCGQKVNDVKAAVAPPRAS